MKVFSNQESLEMTGGVELGEYLKLSRNCLTPRSFKTPIDTGSRTQLAKYFGEVFLGNPSSSAFIAIRGWSAWPSQVNFDLFDRYRASYGEHRRLIESPFHYFLADDKAAFVTVLSLSLYFLWDADIVGLQGGLQLNLSNDEIIELYAPDSGISTRISNMMSEYGCEQLASV